MKRKYFIVLISLCIYFLPALAQNTTDNDSTWNKENLKVVTGFISDIKHKNMEELCNRISFPLERKYPLPDINSREEFIKRYTTVPDKPLLFYWPA